MESSYPSELWHDLYVMLGSSSAVLIGLLFVVRSIYLNEIKNKPVFRIRAYNRTLYLLILFIEAALVLLPQPTIILGTELVAINLLGLWPPSVNIYHFFYRNEEISRGGGGWAISRAIEYIVGFLLGIVGGATLIGHMNWGIYLVTASYVILLVLVVLNASAIMLEIG